MTHRPDSEGQDCAVYIPGRPGDGVMVMDMRGWRPRPEFSIATDGTGRPARTTTGWGRFTRQSDVPLLRAHAATSACEGDGHYACKGCIFLRSADGKHSGLDFYLARANDEPAR